MKLRQKLAVVLASAMVVTAVPVVTMAASTNSLAKDDLHHSSRQQWILSSLSKARDQGSNLYPHGC